MRLDVVQISPAKTFVTYRFFFRGGIRHFTTAEGRERPLRRTEFWRAAKRRHEGSPLLNDA